MKTSPDRVQSQIEALELKLKQAKEKAKKLKAAQVAAAAKAERAKDTRRKILAGAVVLAKMDRGQLVQMHQENVKLAHQEQRATQQLQQMAAAKKEVLNQGKSWARRPEHRTPRGRFVERETGVKAR